MSDYKTMFEASVISISQISEALGIDEEEAACANGNHLILEAIADLKKDAERYRWLRKDDRPCDAVDQVSVSNGIGVFGCATEDELDRAIDSALTGDNRE